MVVIRGIHDTGKAYGRDGQRLAALIESSPLGIVCLDLRGNVTMWNPAAERIFGWESHEVVGSPLPTIPEEKAEEYWSMFPDVLDGEPVTDLEALCRTKSGERITVSISVAPVRDADGDVEGCMGMIVDVTERKRAERELEETNQRLTQIFDQSVDALFIHDEEGNIVECNAEACRSLGYAREELVCMKVSDIANPLPKPPKKPSGENPLWRDLVSGRRDRVAFGFAEHHRRDGTTFPIEVRAGAVVYGGRRMVLASARDVTEREEATEEMARLSRRNQTILDSAGEGIFGVDREMRITFANPAVSRMTGHETDDLIGEVSHELFHHTKPNGEVYSKHECPVYETIETGELRHATNDIFWRRNGTGFPVEYSSTPIRGDEGETNGAVVVFRDVTQRRRNEKLLKERETRFRVLFQNASDLILVSDGRGVIRYASPSVERVLGHRPETLVGKSLLDLIHPEDEARVRATEAEIRKKSGVSQAVEFRVRHANGSWRSHEAIGNNLLREPSVKGIVFNLRDVTERKKLEAQLTHQAFHDSLTGLPNRNLFMDRVEQALRRSGRRDRYVATLFMDLDNFKVVNDTLGHDLGDKLLADLARRLDGCLRLEDTAARFGGDEFTILLEDISGEEEAVRVAERIGAALEEPFKLGGREVFVTTSIGVSLNIFGSERPEDLLRHADIAVYHAKEGGRNRHAVFEPGMNARAMDQMVLGNDLKRALEREEFTILYQPNVRLKTGRIVAVEALLYWDHPERGRLGPGQFIQLAEETGIISRIGRWVLREACRQMGEWRSSLVRPPEKVSVNLSVVQLRSRELVEDVKNALEDTDLPPESLSLEITESLLMEDVYSVIDTLKGLRNLGVGLAIDDFGTGYSSLATLKNLPLDTLKVDKVFVDGLKEGERDASIVRAVIDLAHTLGMVVTAEGVETKEQLELLREMGCEVAQGYYMSRPVPASEAASLLESDALW